MESQNNEVAAFFESVQQAGGEIEAMGCLDDGSGFATVSFPLPATHWIYEEAHEEPPMPFRVGTWGKLLGLTRDEWADAITLAGRYAVRGATMNGQDMDFDPDALIQNLIVGFLGYWTPDGNSRDRYGQESDGNDGNDGRATEEGEKAGGAAEEEPVRRLTGGKEN